MRYGTRSSHKRRWTPLRVRPSWKVKLGYEWGYLYAAINPKEGKLLACLMPSMEKNCFQAFLNELASEAGSPVHLVVDGAGSHKSGLQVPENVELLFLPPRSPELNPVERFFQELRKGLANQVFDSLSAMETKIEQLLQPYFDNPQCLIQLTHYPWMKPVN